jgi:hypothetical protein
LKIVCADIASTFGDKRADRNWRASGLPALRSRSTYERQRGRDT